MRTCTPPGWPAAARPASRVGCKSTFSYLLFVGAPTMRRLPLKLRQDVAADFLGLDSGLVFDYSSSTIVSGMVWKPNKIVIFLKITKTNMKMWT